MSSATAVVYRALLRSARSLGGGQLTLWSAPDAAHWGAGRAAAVRPSNSAADFFPGLRTRPEGEVLSKHELRRSLRAEFEKSPGGPAELDRAFAALKTLDAQCVLNRCAGTTTTHGLVVRVCTAPAPAPPSAAQKRTAAAPRRFVYRISFENKSGVVLKVLSRDYTFLDCNGATIVTVKKGAGVVGHSPVLWPGE